MNPLKPLDWEDWYKDALKFAFGVAVFILVLCLFVLGVSWLIGSTDLRKEREELAQLVTAAFFLGFFVRAINSIHERLSQIAEAVKHNDG